jgi:WD40 repeat protein
MRPIARRRPPSIASAISYPNTPAPGLGSGRFHHGAPLHHVSYAPDGRSLVAIDIGGFVRVWDASNGRIIREIGDPRAAPWRISSPREIALSPDGPSLAMIEVKPPGRLQLYVLIGPDKGSIRLWELPTGRERARLSFERLDARSLAFSPDGRRLAVAVTDGTVRLFDPATGQERGSALGPVRARRIGATSRSTRAARGNSPVRRTPCYPGGHLW